MTGPELIRRLASLWGIGAEKLTATRTQTEALVNTFYLDARKAGFEEGASVSYENLNPKEPK